MLFSRSFVVQVDEEAKREAALPNDQPIGLQRLFLGGIPAEVEQVSNRANVPFQGCIWNLMVNAVYVQLCQATHPGVYWNRKKNFFCS